MTQELWPNDDRQAWQAALDSYPAVVEAQGVAKLPPLDHWYREELPRALAERSPAYVTLDELGRVTEWKMARGVWRHRNLLLVRSNDPELVEATSRDALARVPDPRKPVAALAELAGVGPATASAVLSAAAPDVYPFYDDLVAAQIPGYGKVDFSLRGYVRYADALRDRARQLGGNWTPTLVERALWAYVGGKTGERRMPETHP